MAIVWPGVVAPGLLAQSGTQELKMTVGKSVVIDYPSDIGRISTSNPDIVDVVSITAREILVNAKANGHRVTVVRRDVLDEDPPDCDVILAGDCWYDGRLAERVLPWLQRASAAGIDILVGDPGRRFLPVDELVELATYDVQTTTEIEDMAQKQARVYALRPAEDVSRRPVRPAPRGSPG